MRVGRPIRQYQQALAVDIAPAEDTSEQWMAIWGEGKGLLRVDATFIALDRRKTGSGCLGRALRRALEGLKSFTWAPRAIKNLVIEGDPKASTESADSSYASRGTGERKWRLQTIPGRESPATKPGKETRESWAVRPEWITGTYARSTTTMFWDNAKHLRLSNRGKGRAGDNLYSNGLLALDRTREGGRWRKLKCTPLHAARRT